MNKQFLLAAALLCGQAATTARAQTPAPQQGGQNVPPVSSTIAPSAPPQQQQPRPAPPRATGLDLAEYGVEFAPEPRLIVMMAALEAAGFDPTPQGGSPSVFRQVVRKDLLKLDPDLRQRMQTFYRRNRLPDTATPGEQTARYVSLAYALGPVPTFDAPPRSDELPDGVLEVLDFAPLIREFYRRSGIDERMPDYMRAYTAEADRLRRPTVEMVRAAVSYLRIRPETVILERVQSGSPDAGKNKKQKDERKVYITRERARRFVIVPDLLAAPGAINFRIIGDNYYAVIPYGTDPANSELRRAYLQYLVDPLILRFNREIAARRPDLRQLLEERIKANPNVTPDVFLAVGRSVVAAADARLNETTRLDALRRETSARLQAARDDAARNAIAQETQRARAAIEEATALQLAENFERGAPLVFYFAEQLRGLETSGFDLASSFADMITSFDVAREKNRTGEFAAAFTALEARRKQQQQATRTDAPLDPATERRLSMLRELSEVEKLLQLRSHGEAETRLRAMMATYPHEPRIYFALGQATSLSAQDVFDEGLQAERLNRALEHYRLVVQNASPETDAALISRAHAAMGRILAFFDRTEEARREFDAAIKIGPIKDGAYKEAVEARQKLSQPE